MANKTVKRCAPFLDAYMTGYIQETWTDIYIEIKNEQLLYHYAMGPEPLATRDFGFDNGMHQAPHCYPVEFVWRTPWVPKLPKGYSMLYTQPLNHPELPFEVSSAIVDCDDFLYGGYPTSYPFRVHKHFTGLIPAGTPMFQMIPIKRESWTGKSAEFDERLFQSETARLRRFFQNGYRNLIWKRKVYR